VPMLGPFGPIEMLHHPAPFARRGRRGQGGYGWRSASIVTADAEAWTGYSAACNRSRSFLVVSCPLSTEV
jgi:hypothetical protein